MNKKTLLILAFLLLFSSTVLLAQRSLNDRKKPTISNPNEKPNVKHQIVEYTGNKTENKFTMLCKTKSGTPFVANVQKGSSDQYLWIQIVPTNVKLGSNPQPDLQQLSLEYLQTMGTMLQANETISYSQVQFEKDNLGMTHTKFQILYNQIEIYGAEVMVHSKGNQIESIQGLFLFPPKNLSVLNNISKENALTIAKSELQMNQLSDSLTVMNGFKIDAHSEKLIVYYGKDGNATPRLCWLMEMHSDLLHRDFLFIDATTGEILNKLNGLCEANGPKTTTVNDYLGNPRTLNTYEYNGNFYMIDASRPMFKASSSTMPNDPVGAIWTLDAQNTDAGGSLYQVSSSNNNIWNSVAVSAHSSGQKCFEYYKNTHARNSIDGAGGTIISVVNVTTSTGSGLDNAYWNGSFMAYGNGKSVFKPLAAGLDVGGHEMTHGVVEKTANLEYQGQSGAINESMADIFGAMIDRDDWKMGEDIVKLSYFPSGAMRDLSDPHNGASNSSQNGYQPRVMSEYITGSADNGGVHANSGIPNWAYYKIATSITKEKAELIYYRTLSMYLTKTSQFLDLRFAVVKAATDLYGASSAEVTAVKDAFDAVQIYDPNPSTGGGGGGGGGTGAGGTFDLPANSGTERVLSYDTDNTTASTLYISTTTPSNFSVLSTTKFNRKPSATDNGINVYFVDVNGYLRRLASDNSYTENTISNQNIWSNIAISKDGSKLAAITTVSDTSIWVYNFSLTTWKRYKLYNPTYSGVNSTGVYSVDALEWDAAGENIIYDAANKTTLNNGTTLQYWDIGIVKVWDNRAATWGDGKVQKLFNQLPESISIGNPAFSKNSPYIVAFDYIDDANTINAVMGYNLSTNNSSVVAISDKLTNPSFSRLDNKILFDDISSSVPVIKLINLQSDKITPVAGSDADFISEGEWGIWLTYGTRRLKNDAKDLISFSFPSLTPPVQGVISGNTVTLTVPQLTNLTALIPTFTNSPASIVTVSGTEQTSGTSSQNFSNTKVYRVIAQDNTTKDYNVVVKFATNSVQNNSKTNVIVSPQPAVNEITINSEVNALHLSDVNGKEIPVEFKSLNNQTIVSISHLPQGIYFVKVQLADGIQTLKIIKSN